MKLAKLLPGKLFFKPRKTRSVADPASFTSETASSSSEDEDVLKKPNGFSTPTSVLPSAEMIIDRDGHGKIIKKAELERLLCRLGAEPPSQEELDGDGDILEEFNAISSALATPASDGELRETFDFFDSDGDGRITAEELFEVFKTIGDGGCTLEDCRRIISGVNTNGDGFVCFEDFSRMMDLQHR